MKVLNFESTTFQSRRSMLVIAKFQAGYSAGGAVAIANGVEEKVKTQHRLRKSRQEAFRILNQKFFLIERA